MPGADGASASRRSEEIPWLAFWIWSGGLIADPQLLMAGMRPKRRETIFEVKQNISLKIILQFFVLFFFFGFLNECVNLSPLKDT